MIKARPGLRNLESLIPKGFRSETPEGTQHVPMDGWSGQDNTSETSRPYTDPRDARIPPNERT